MENYFKIVGDIDHINEIFNSMRQSHPWLETNVQGGG